jgi:hypothetical protein
MSRTPHKWLEFNNFRVDGRPGNEGEESLGSSRLDDVCRLLAMEQQQYGNIRTRLETARRRVAEQERLVAIWRETMSSGLTEEGQSTELAQKMLQLMERRLDAFRADLAKLAN